MFLLKQILAREAKLRGLICSFKNIKFQGKTIRPIGPRQKHSIVFEMNMPSQLNRNLSNCEVARKKKVFQDFNEIRTRGLCVRAAVLYQLSYEDPYTGSRPIY